MPLTHRLRLSVPQSDEIKSKMTDHNDAISQLSESLTRAENSLNTEKELWTEKKRKPRFSLGIRAARLPKIPARIVRDRCDGARG